ncbi:hypothetical protein TNCV_2083131 [Trichonephila clavipes]|nr:hypothetical protein TNCV_2083131 [Trichonephila clavipes]
MARSRVENREGSLGHPQVCEAPCLPKIVNPRWVKEKITRAPRERETRTHLKKICFSIVHFVHNLELDGWGSEKLTHFGSRLQSVEEYPPNAHLEHAS